MYGTQSCPSCHSSKSTNASLRFLVNVCGHILCESCVETLYMRGSGLCVTCKLPIRKANFSLQLFEDPLVQKEVDIRKKILYDFNKRESDFDTLEEYDLYLEKIEELVYNLSNDENVEDTKRYIDNYKRENKDIIKKNRTKPNDLIVFYDIELEREREIAEAFEKEDQMEFEEWKQSRLDKREKTLKGALGEFVESQKQAAKEEDKNADFKAPMAPPSSIMANDPSKRFIPPPSASTSFRAPSSSQMMAPPSGVSTRTFGMVPSSSMAVPPSMSMSYNTPASASQWAQNSAYHNVTMQPPSALLASFQYSGGALEHSKRSKADRVLLDTNIPTKMSKTSVPGPYEHVPLKTLLFGPEQPTETSPRWPTLVSLYDTAEIQPLTADESRGPLPEGVQPGLSHALPIGACGISPITYMERALQESRCGLFLRNE